MGFSVGSEQNMWRSISLLLVALLFGCATPKRSDYVTPLPYANSDEDVYLAIWHHMFAHWKGHKHDFPEKFFLSVKEHDAPAELLQKFHDEGFDVAPGSQYAHGKGIHCSVEKVEPNSATEVKVWGGYLFGDLGGEWGYFTLRKVRGKWTVLSWEPKMFS